jgi:hypothetical protein
MPQRPFDLRAASGGEAVAGRAVQFESGEAVLGVVAVELQMDVGQGVEQHAVLGPQRILIAKEIGQWSSGRGGPGAERGHELVARDHPVLKCQKAE